jgi:hypothetical protein
LVSARYVYDPSRPFGQRFVQIPLDWRPTPRPRLAVHGVKEPFRSHADGRWYDDSRTYEREVRARGYEIVGNDLKPADFAPAPFECGDVKHDILSAASELGTPLK